MATWNKGIDTNRLMGLEYAWPDAAESKSALSAVEEPSKSEHIDVHIDVQFVGELLYLGGQLGQREGSQSAVPHLLYPQN